MPKKDFAQLALSIVRKVSGEEPVRPIKRGRAGGLKGGKARAALLTKEKRAAIAKIAATARWKKKR